MSRRNCRVDTTYADQEQHREHAEHVALERRVAVGGCAEQHEAQTAERDEREHQRTRIDVLREQHARRSAR